MLDSLHPEAANSLQLGEGLLLADFDPAEALASADPASALSAAVARQELLLGATQEGCVFRCVSAIVDPGKRGQRTPTAASVFPGSWQVTLTGVLMEMTPANAARLLNCAAPNDGSAVSLQPGGFAPMHRLTWVGSLGRGVLLIELHNPVSTGGLTLRCGKTGAGSLPFSLMACQDAGSSMPPCRLHWLREVTL